MKLPIRSERLQGLKRLALWTIILAGIISGTYIVLDEFMQRPLSGISLSMGQGPVRIVHTLDSETGKFSEMRVARDGGDPFYVTAMTSAGEEEYLMLAQTDTPATNVYRRSSDGSLTQVTSTDSLKYDLSVDRDSGMLAYVTSSAATTNELMQEGGGDIVLYNQATGEERMIASGAGPVLLSSNELIYRDAGSLMYRDTEQDEAVPLTKLPAYPKSGVGAVYAVDTENWEVAVYDHSSRRIDVFAIEGGQLLPKRSLSVSAAPDALTYADGKLTWASVLSLGEMRNFLFAQEDSVRTARAITTGVSPLGYPITLYVTNN